MPPPVPSVASNTTFKLTGHTDAEAVAIYGSFNGWIQTKNYCAREGDRWVCRVDLPPGKYTYRFLVDGAGLIDPTNPDTEGNGNGQVDSEIVIRENKRVRQRLPRQDSLTPGLVVPPQGFEL